MAFWYEYHDPAEWSMNLEWMMERASTPVDEGPSGCPGSEMIVGSSPLSTSPVQGHQIGASDGHINSGA